MRIVAPLMLLMLGTAAANAEDAPPYPVKDCSQLTVQMELNACAGANLKAADVALNKAYQQAMAQQTDASSRRQLADVERAWIAYRDRECAFEVGPQENGGSIWPMEMNNCLEQMTAARLHELVRLGGCTADVNACNPH